MKFVNKLSVALFLLPFFSVAQSNYQPGYVVTVKGDTVHGFINYQAWDVNPTAISFKNSINNPAKKEYTLNDISLFTVNNLGVYKKYTCSISMDNTNSIHLGEGRDTTVKVETVFLKILQQGKNVALYSYADNLKTRFYIGEAPGYTPIELVFRLYYDLSAQANGRTVNENTYQKQLFALANKYNALDDQLIATFPNTSYVKDDLIAIVSKINHISKTEFVKKYAEQSEFSLYGSVALNVSTTMPSSGSGYTSDGGISSTSYLPAIAFGVDFVPDPTGGKIEFRADISINPAQYNASFKLKVSPYTQTKAGYDQLSIFLTPQALFNIYNKPGFKFYAGIGLAMSYSTFSNAVSPFQSVEPYYFSKFDNALLLKGGFRIHKNWEIYFDYFNSLTITRASFFDLNDVSKQIGISYFLGK